MPLVDFATLPGTSRVWVFGSATPLDSAAEQALMQAVDGFLHLWKAHGAPLTVGRNWRDHRFLTVAVDTSQENASGCSIDGLFRELRRIDTEFGSSFIGGGRVFFRAGDGAVQAVDRSNVDHVIEKGELTRETVVFDPTVQTLADWRDHFETIAERSWHGALLPTSA